MGASIILGVAARNDGLRSAHPVTDCSGWVAVLLAAGVQAANIATGHTAFSDGDISDVNTA
jgi:hypothetical protein